MKTVYRSNQCYQIAHSTQYIAAMGHGITVLKRDTFEFVHRFTGLRWIHGGLFLNEDILAVYTGEQRLYFFQISEKKLLWACPRPRQLASSGDMECCQIPGTEKLACIARGKKDMREHFLLVADCKNQTFSIQEIPNCYCVVRSLALTRPLGLTALSYEAKGDGAELYRLIRIEEGRTSVLNEWESFRPFISAYSGNYVFLEEYAEHGAQLYVHPLDLSKQSQPYQCEDAVALPIPSYFVKGPWVGAPGKFLLPSVSWVDEESGLLTACRPEWIGVCDFHNQKLLAEYSGEDIHCGIILDGNLLIGRSKGIAMEHLNFL